MSTLKTLWSDESGFVVSSELILIASIAVMGLMVGLSTVRDQIVAELADVANAMGNLNQTYSYSGVTGHSSSVAGTIFLDLVDFCDGTQTANSFANCIFVVDASGGG